MLLKAYIQAVICMPALTGDRKDDGLDAERPFLTEDSRKRRALENKLL